MKTTNAPQLLTPEIARLVDTYLLARTFAEVMRGRVDAVHLEILTECPIWTTPEISPRMEEPRKILKSSDLYLTVNEAEVRDFYDEADHRLKKLKIKPQDMEKDHCPALVAEHDLTKVEWALIDVSGAPFGVDSSNIMCCKNGLENRQKWLDLVVGLHVQQPGFVNPLTKLIGRP